MKRCNELEKKTSTFIFDKFVDDAQTEVAGKIAGRRHILRTLEMSNLYRGPSIDASYQVFVHLAKRFRRRFKKF
jgi:hypothetical protein